MYMLIITIPLLVLGFTELGLSLELLSFLFVSTIVREGFS